MTDLMTHDAGELVRRVRARDLGAGVVVALYRLVKVALLHEATNQALLRQVEQTREAIVDYCTRAGLHVSILFTTRAVFVAGELLKGSRAVYESALELGAILDWCGGAELSVARDVTSEDLHGFAEAVARAKAHERGSFESPSPRVRLRAVTEAARLRGLELEELDLEARILRTYSMAVVTLRRFYDELHAGHLSMPPQIKRVAQNIVDLSEWKAFAFLGVSEVRNANADEAGRAVNSAILAVAMARQLTEDRLRLSQLALSALVHDAGRPRAATLGGVGGPLREVRAAVHLAEDLEDRLPAGTAVVLTALGRVNEPTIVRTVVTFEAQWLRRGKTLGPVYRGLRGPTLQARILSVARRYNDLMTPSPGEQATSPEVAVRVLASELGEASDWTVLRMLASALRIYPLGTVVLLSSGVSAEVVRSGGARKPPLVRPVLDAEGGVIEAGQELDLRVESHLEILRVVGIEGWKRAPSTAPRARTSAPPVSLRRSSRPALPRRTSEPPRGRTEDLPLTDGPTLGAEDRTVLRASPLEDVMTPAVPAALTPSARGTLGVTPLVHVLVYVLEHDIRGSIELIEPDGIRHRIYFRGGSPVKVRVGRMVSPLGELLVGAGLVDESGAMAAVDEARRVGLRLGEFLVSEGVIGRVELARALEAQLVAKIAGLVNLPPDTQYTLYRNVDLLEDTGPEGFVPCDGLNAVLSAVRLWHDRDRVRRALGRIAPVPLRLDERALISGLELPDGERTAMDTLLAGPAMLADLMEPTTDPEGVASLLYALAVTRQLVLPAQKGGTRVGPMGGGRFHGRWGQTAPPPRPSLPPRAPSGPPASTASPSTPVSSSASKSAPPTKAPSSPPSARPSATPPPLPAMTIAPPPPPAAPSIMPPSNQAAPSLDEAQRALEAIACARRAEQAFDRGDLSGAERYAQRARSLAPDVVEHDALHAWIQAASGKPAAVASSLTRLSAILERDPECELALLSRGKLLLRAGKSKAALRDFDALLEVNPTHREAASQAHLARKRISKKP